MDSISIMDPYDYNTVEFSVGWGGVGRKYPRFIGYAEGMNK